MVEDGIAAILPYARAHNMPLAIEPLHPMYAGGPRLREHARAGARLVRGIG